MNRQKKIVAAISAVVDYIKTEEQEVWNEAGSDFKSEQFYPFNAWASAGRQYQMQNRNLIQLKAFNINKS